MRPSDTKAATCCHSTTFDTSCNRHSRQIVFGMPDSRVFAPSFIPDIDVVRIYHQVEISVNLESPDDIARTEIDCSGIVVFVTWDHRGIYLA